MSCEVHRSPSSALSPLTSLATSASVLVLTISPLLAQTPLHFLWRQNVCGLLWEAFHHTVSCKRQTQTSALHCSPALGPLTASVTSCSASWWFGCALSRGLHSALQEGGPPSPLPFRGFSPASSSPEEALPLRKGSASYLQFACDHLDQVRREEKPFGLHFLRSSFTNSRADAFSPDSASQLVETPQGRGV